MTNSEPRVYGVWGGCPKGKLEDPKRCIAVVWSRRSYVEHQCSRLRGHGTDGLFCKQHAKNHVMVYGE